MESMVRWLLGLKGERLAEDAEWTVRFLSALPMWVTLLVVVPLIALFVSVIYRREAGTATTFSRVGMAVLRFCALLLVVLMIYDPVVAVERTLTRRSYVAVLVDDSLSMELKDHYEDAGGKARMALAAGLIDRDRLLTPEENERFDELSRMDLVRRVLDTKQKAFLDKLSDKYRVRLYAFSSSLKRDVETASLRPQGRLTKIGEALRETAADLKGQPVAAMVLISDGCENDGPPAVQVARDLGRRDLPIPVHVVGVGSPEAPRDLQVLHPEAEETILVGDEWEVEVTVRHHGYELRNVELRLVEEDRIVASREVLLGKSGVDQREKIAFRPDKPGRYTFKVEVPVQEGEIIPDNNAVVVHLTVVDDKIKVLYVDQYPRWEYRYLKNALIRDSAMLVNCLLVSADPTFPQEKSPTPRVTPLQAFPETKRDLFAFDVIILGDVNPEGESARSIFLQPDRQMTWIEEFVRLLGGGLVIISGPNFMPHALEGSMLEPLLPVKVPERDAIPRGPMTEAFRVRRTFQGKRNPVLSFDTDPERNEKLWEDPRFALPGFYWYVPSLKRKPGATVLARHPAHPAGVAENQRDPIFAYQYYGAGKVFFTATDETWRWRFRYGDRWFYRFWRNVIRFVGQQRLLGEKKRFQLTLNKTEYILGEPVRVTAKILDENYLPSVRPEQEIFLEGPDGAIDKKVLKKKPGEDGVFEESITLDRLGTYRVWIEETMPSGETKKLTPVTFSIKVPRREYENPLMDRVLLRQTADMSGGSFRFLHEIDQIPDLVKRPPQVIPGMPVIMRLWDSWLFYALLICLLTAEWIYRKWHRLL